MLPGACSKSAVSYLTGIESQGQHAVKAGLDKLQSVGRSWQEEGGGKPIPLFADTHIHNVAGCCIYILWDLQQENHAYQMSRDQSKAGVTVRQNDCNQRMMQSSVALRNGITPDMQGSMLSANNNAGPLRICLMENLGHTVLVGNKATAMLGCTKHLQCSCDTQSYALQ